MSVVTKITVVNRPYAPEAPIDLNDLSLVQAYKDWLANEASYAEKFWHDAAEASAQVWRRIANERLAARQKANSPW